MPAPLALLDLPVDLLCVIAACPALNLGDM